MNGQMTKLFVSDELLRHYEPIEIVGQGAFAIVFKAKNKRTGELVAIKHFQTSGGNQRKFFHELKFVVTLKHPHIMDCLDLYNSEEDSCDLIFEFAEMGSLRDVLEQEGTLIEADALKAITHAARALDYAHDQGIIHRDVKPENILLFGKMPKPVYKLMDFGIAKVLNERQMAATSVGSPAYMAPEQFYDEYDYKTDIYSLGVILFELLHGNVPFSGSAGSIFKAHLEKQPSIKSSLHPKVQALLSSLLSKEPKDRPSAKEILKLMETLRREVSQTPDELKTKSDNEPSAPDFSQKSKQKVSASSVFDDMFGENVEDDIVEEETQASLDFTELVQKENNSKTPIPTVSSRDSRQDIGEDSDPFGAFSDGDEEEEQHLTSSNNGLNEESSYGALDGMTGKEKLGFRSGSDLFEETFASEDDPQVDIRSRIDKTQKTSTPDSVGRLEVNREWFRAIDSRSLMVMNLTEAGITLVASKSGLFELKNNGRLGKQIYAGKPESIETPTDKYVPIVSEGQIRVLNAEGEEVKTWELTREVDCIAIAPDLSAVAVKVGRNIVYHDSDGNAAWTARFNDGERGPFMSFDSAARLMVGSYESEDQAVHFFNSEGQEVASHWLPGQICSATRCFGVGGAWCVVKRRNGFQLIRVALEGISSTCMIEEEIRGPVGGSTWVAGIGRDNRLVIIDPETSSSTHIQTRGEIIDLELGEGGNSLLVLERYQEVVKYLGCIDIQKKSVALSETDQKEGAKT